MKSKKKLNDGCLKIFKFIQLLYEDKAYYNDVINIFKDEINEQSANNIQVTLNKYINTLKIFGIKLKKENNKYTLLSSLYSINFTLEDLKSISLLLTSVKNFPEENLSKEIAKFANEIQKRMNNDDKTTLSSLNSLNNYDFSFYYSDLKEQIKHCEQLCNGDFQINVRYRANGKELNSKCNPKEVIYDSKTAYLQVYDINKRQNLEIPLNNIIELKESPQKASHIEANSTVVYKLKNRLAKTYNLKENEYSQGYDENDNYIVINKNEPLDKLIKRLMRYGASCEIVSPKFLREEMFKTINDTINNYGETE